jgi:hypothetical protein
VNEAAKEMRMKVANDRKTVVLMFSVCLCLPLIAGSGGGVSAANANEPGLERVKQILEAAGDGDLARVKLMLTEDPNLVNRKGPYGTTPLHAAVEAGHKEIVEFLISRGADVNAKQSGPVGLAPLHIAAFKDYRDLAELLLAAGALVNIRENSGKTALHGAAWHGCKEMAQVFIAKGAEINTKDDMNKTALDYALAQGHTEIADLLRANAGQQSPLSVRVEQVDDTIDANEVARRLFGKYVARTTPKDVSPLVSRLCEPYRFYNVTISLKHYIAGFGPDQTYPMAYGKQAFKLSNAEEVATFMTSLNRSVTNELEALEKTLVFAELIGRTIQTHMPKRKSVMKEYANQKAEDWRLVISGTDSGWAVSVTLLKDPEPGIENSWRYDLEISKDGQVSVASERLVYQYAALL